MIALGTTPRCSLPPRHIWIVITDPACTNGEILLVNLTTLPDDCVDDTCILGPADFSLLTRRTTVAYSRALVGKVANVELLIGQGDRVPVTAIPAPPSSGFFKGRDTAVS
jgi:hypothetical protein